MTKAIRVLLVDDHVLFREGVRAVLGTDPGIVIVGEAGNGDEAVVRAEHTRPDVVLLDLRMPGTDGIAAIHRLRRQADPPSILVLTTYDADRDVVPAMQAGATGYLLKDASRSELVGAIHAAANGRPVVAPGVVQHLVNRSRGTGAGAGSDEDALRPRELDVLRLVAEGATNRQAAARLHVSEATVKACLLRIYQKLEVRDRASAVAEAYRRQLLE
jgi:DNA-binding NarL/FixJ family response regulator